MDQKYKLLKMHASLKRKAIFISKFVLFSPIILWILWCSPHYRPWLHPTKKEWFSVQNNCYFRNTLMEPACLNFKYYMHNVWLAMFDFAINQIQRKEIFTILTNNVQLHMVSQWWTMLNFTWYHRETALVVL